MASKLVRSRTARSSCRLLAAWSTDRSATGEASSQIQMLMEGPLQRHSLWKPSFHLPI